ncbi:hypothetical protein MUP56_01115, partial [Patescibacteria group bacterium]|nr:hypothetical protein [Patescibacteria group bacterium]
MKGIIHTLTGIGPSHFARYMAGCVCEDEEQVYEKIEVHKATQLMNQGVNRADAQIQAHQIVVENRAVDDTFKENDKQGIEGKGPNFSFTKDGDVRFSGYNGSLHSNYADQQVVFPYKYNPKEHTMVLSAYESLRNGAKQAAHIVHEYNEQGELDIRDVVLLTFNPDTNIGEMHILNISSEGKNHKTLESARTAMQERLGGFKEEVKSEGVFLFVREENPINPLSLFRDTIIQHEIHEKPFAPLYDYDEGVSRKFPTLQSKKEVIPFVRQVFQADETPNTIPFRLPSYLQRLTGKDEKEEKIQQNNQRRETNKKQQKSIVERAHKTPEIKKTESSKEMHPVIMRIEHQKATMDEKKKSITFAVKTGVGIGGALFILDALKESVKPITKKEKRELRKMKKEIKMERHKKTRLAPAPPDPSRRGRPEADRGESTPSRESRRTKRQRIKETKKLSEKEMKKQKHKETLHIVFTLKEKKRKQPRQEKKLIIVSKEKRNKILFKKHEKELGLHTVLEKITRKIRKEVIYAKGKQERKIIRPKESVRGSILEFTRAWILFMLLRPSFIEKQQHEKKENVLFIRKNNKEEKTIHEFSPWILLSIIWYLTMIREQGKAVIIPKKKKKK